MIFAKRVNGPRYSATGNSVSGRTPADSAGLFESTAAESPKAGLAAILEVGEMAIRNPKGISKANPSRATDSNAITWGNRARGTKGKCR